MRGWRLGVVGVLVCVSAGAQTPERTVGEALRSLASRASDIVVGQVEAITRKAGVVEIRLRVDTTVQGAAGSEYTFREWAGLWPPGQARYFVGQRALFFLQGGTGLSSPVDDADGVVPVVLQDGGPLADVRRLDARVMRDTGSPLPPNERATVRLADAGAVAAGWQEPSFEEPVREPLPVSVRPKPMPIVSRLLMDEPQRSPQAMQAPMAEGMTDAQ